jgi:hypothetical protein
MKTTLYKFIFVFLLAPAVAFANETYNGKYTRQKTLKKEYAVSAGDLVKLDNSYGNIDIVTWDQNRVEIEVIIKTNGNDKEKVIQRLDEISVKFGQGGGEVSAQTIFKEDHKSWWNNLMGGSSNVNMEINYRVKAPVTNSMDISNDYGSINLDKLEGNARISCDYGRFMIGELRGDINHISFDYTRNSFIEYVKKAKINADYSEFRIEEARSIELTADYTDSYFAKVENILFNNDYGSLKIDKLRNIKGQGDYLGVKLGLVYSTAEIDMDYGSLDINKVKANFKHLNIATDYTSVKIGYDQKAAYNFDVITSYGGIKGLDGSNFTIKKRHQSGGNKHFQGSYGSGNSGGTINIKSDYGSVTFNEY